MGSDPSPLCDWPPPHPGAPITARSGATWSALELLVVPVLDRLDAADHAQSRDRDLARARVEADVVRLAGAVGEQCDPALAGREAVRDRGTGGARDHAAGAHVVGLIAQPANTLPLEHDEQLLPGR